MVLALLCTVCVCVCVCVCTRTHTHTQQQAVGDITPLQTLSSPPYLMVVNSSCASTVLLYQRRLRLQTPSSVQAHLVPAVRD